MMSQRIEGIQILRFFAAALVLFGHTFAELRDARLISDHTFLTLDRFPWGAGVDIFFVISGYIIFSVATNSGHSPGQALHFFGRRVIRVVPVYWFYTALMLAAIVIFPSALKNTTFSPVNFISSLFFIPSINGHGAIRPMLEQGWTLNYEFFFYTLVALSILMPQKWRLLLVILSLTLVQVTASFLEGHSWLAKFYGYDVMYEFLLGAILYRFWARQAALPFFVRIFAVFLGFGLLWLNSNLGLQLPRCIGQGLPALLIVAACLFSLPQNSLTITRPLVVMGDASYSLYLSHPFAVNATFLVLRKLGAGNAIAIFVVAVLMAFGLAYASYRLIELPANSALRKKWDAHTGNQLMRQSRIHVA
jgi:exopolysaccharide production protein ExoZ